MKSENMAEIDDGTKFSPSLVHHLPSVLNTNHVKPQLMANCIEASTIGRDLEEAKASANERAPIPALRNLKLQTSDVCHKKFIIFDRCDTQSTVILHPSWLQSPLVQSSPKLGTVLEMNGFLNSFQGLNSTSLKSMFDLQSSAAGSTSFGDAVEPSLQVKQKASNLHACGLVDSMGCEACSLEKQILGRSNHMVLEQESLSEFHEDTEEINALLSSDDELSSTGHSPSDAGPICYSEELATNIVGRKRKLEELAVDEVDDADSGSGQPLCRAMYLTRSLGSCSASPTCGNGHKSTQSDLQHGKISYKNLCSLKFHTLGPVSAYQSYDSQPCRTIGQGRLMDRTKRMNIESNVEHLRGVIPGGQLLDTAGVLGRTIHYVKRLQESLGGLEASREPVGPVQQIG